MYPIIRLIKERLKFGTTPLGLFETHVSHHLCWPWDLDPWMELNNGRTLTLFDLGRIPWSVRIGMIGALRHKGWGMTIAGSSVRYRRRIRMFQRVEMRSRCIGWDHRFFYMEQAMWRHGEALNHVLVRMAITSPAGIIAPDTLVQAMDQAQGSSPPLPDWVSAWVTADSMRPWPPIVGKDEALRP